MTQISEQCVLFADLRGSTALFESVGNAAATALVTQSIAAMARTVPSGHGRVVKTLGDGLMAVFDSAVDAVRAALLMHDALDQITKAHNVRTASGMPTLRLQVGVARGEVVAVAGDCFGDAVNVAARLLDHAGDNETLITGEVLAGLPALMSERFRSLDRIVLRGRVEPVLVHALGPKRVSDTAATLFGDLPLSRDEPDTLRLRWSGHVQAFGVADVPVVVGRSPQATFLVDDSRVSRSHARIDWHGGSFQLTDLSYNGTYVRFADGEIVSLRRGSCLLHGSGAVGLGGSPIETSSAYLEFDVYRRACQTPSSLS